MNLLYQPMATRLSCPDHDRIVHGWPEIHPEIQADIQVL
jgi:hypothetical protein